MSPNQYPPDVGPSPFDANPWEEVAREREEPEQVSNNTNKPPDNPIPREGEGLGLIFQPLNQQIDILNEQITKVAIAIQKTQGLVNGVKAQVKVLNQPVVSALVDADASLHYLRIGAKLKTLANNIGMIVPDHGRQLVRHARPAYGETSGGLSSEAPRSDSWTRDDSPSTYLHSSGSLASSVDVSRRRRRKKNTLEERPRPRRDVSSGSRRVAFRREPSVIARRRYYLSKSPSSDSELEGYFERPRQMYNTHPGRRVTEHREPSIIARRHYYSSSDCDPGEYFAPHTLHPRQRYSHPYRREMEPMTRPSQTLPYFDRRLARAREDYYSNPERRFILVRNQQAKWADGNHSAYSNEAVDGNFDTDVDEEVCEGYGRDFDHEYDKDFDEELNHGPDRELDEDSDEESKLKEEGYLLMKRLYRLLEQIEVAQSRRIRPAVQSDHKPLQCIASSGYGETGQNEAKGKFRERLNKTAAHIKAMLANRIIPSKSKPGHETSIMDR
ncbi:hypothetical protein BO71DRAFT_489397 [Aspergillus ellipticus CBS 707.79]|uniref:Uncharacterized protein n=1 Tax=Aspergillus ellipticus CBS 707.79 TaxID=1448320 RepID=A0A319DHR4_9EURO|nr:hypothetical protein BO71DRAFT_489397 [Aspergillus ellipticus CBS 707.79]